MIFSNIFSRVTKAISNALAVFWLSHIRDTDNDTIIGTEYSADADYAYVKVPHSDGSAALNILNNNNNVVATINDDGDITMIGNRTINAYSMTISTIGNLNLSPITETITLRDILINNLTNGLKFGIGSSQSILKGNGAANYCGVCISTSNISQGSSTFYFKTDGCLGINIDTNNLFELYNPKSLNVSNLGYFSVSVVNGSPLVTRPAGLYYDLRDYFKDGDKINIQPSPPFTFSDSYEILSVDSATQITLISNYLGNTKSTTLAQIDNSSQSKGSHIIVGRHGLILIKEGNSLKTSATEKLDVELTTKTEGRRHALSTKTADYTVGKSDENIIINSASNTVTITLPAIDATNHGQTYTFKAKDITNTCKLTATGTDTFENGLTDYTFTILNEFIKVIADNDSKQWIEL